MATRPMTPIAELYLDMLSHVASVLKQNSARWRSLAYVKLSGANSRSAENRLPNGCKAGPGCICNNQRWAEAGYTPDGLYTFYREQMARIARDFPGKSMSYPLIQDGFPRVNNDGCYLNETNAKICPPGVNTPMVGPFAQTAGHHRLCPLDLRRRCGHCAPGPGAEAGLFGSGAYTQLAPAAHCR